MIFFSGRWRWLSLWMCMGFWGGNAQAVCAADPEPVILLTGFEPFGAGRPPNASWEGIKGLDGKTWKKHRLAARQLPVVWGAPRPHLEKWIEELRPVAIFSFGTGGGYTLETVADNRRADIKDNAGDLPKKLEIVPEGPARYQASIAAQSLQAELAKVGHRVRLSQEAGDYLCEECLYTLEHLKATRFAGSVLFCHVPPLQTDRHTPEQVQQFVTDLLDAWLVLNAKK